MIFNAPERLLYLLPLAALVVLLAWKRRKPYIAHPFLLQIAARLRPASRWIYLPRALEVLALAVMLPALLSPVLPLVRYAVSNEGLDIMLTLDLSSSMEEPIDMVGALRRERQGIVIKEKTRLESVKEAMIRFAESRRSLTFSVNAQNVFNHVTITSVGTTVNSANYGLPTAASPTRALTLNSRFNF